MTTFIIRTEQQRERVSRIIGAMSIKVPQRVTLEDHKPTRSLDQNRLYWALMSRVSQAMPAHMDGQWHAPEVWHEYMKRRFLGVESLTVDGEELPVPRSTRKLRTNEFSDYYTQVEVWAAEHGIYLETA